MREEFYIETHSAFGENMASTKAIIGRATFVGDDDRLFTEASKFIGFIRKELPYYSTTGFRFEVLTDDPAVRKAVDDIVYDFYGEENHRSLDEYANEPESGMTMEYI